MSRALPTLCLALLPASSQKRQQLSLSIANAPRFSSSKQGSASRNRGLTLDRDSSPDDDCLYASQLQQLGLDRYLHQSLRRQGNIRVLVLEPAQNLTDGLIGTLREIAFGELRYTALSYSWTLEDDTGTRSPHESPPLPGDSSFTERLFLDDALLLIGKNLRDALRRLREKSAQPHILWVDAVCINQQDSAEKGTQVAMMSSIYEQAEWVVAWLGEGTQHTNESAYKGLTCLMAEEDERQLSVPPLSSHSWCLKHSWIPEQNFKEGFAPRTCNLCQDWRDHSPLLEGLHTLSQKRYFYRLWIVQEVAIPDAAKVSYQWGCFSMHHNLLLLFHSRYIVSKPPGDTFSGAVGRPCSVRIIYNFFIRNRLPPPGSSLSDFVAYCSEKHCSDPRDKLYGVLGMVPNTGIRPDYSRSHTMEAVHAEFARHLVETGELFLMSNMWGLRSGYVNAIGRRRGPIRTWMPNLRSTLYPFRQLDGRPSDDACWADMQPSLSDDSSELSCRLNYCGTLRQTGAGLTNAEQKPHHWRVRWESPRSDHDNDIAQVSLDIRDTRTRLPDAPGPSRWARWASRIPNPDRGTTEVGMYFGEKMHSGDILFSFSQPDWHAQTEPLFKGVLRPTGMPCQWHIIATWTEEETTSPEYGHISERFLWDRSKLPCPERRLFHVV